MDNPKSGGAEGFQRAIGKPFGRLRRGETPAWQAIKKLLFHAKGKALDEGVLPHPFTAPPIMPPTIFRRKMTNTASVGSRTIMLAAMTGP